jgi:hypothetical protein
MSDFNKYNVTRVVGVVELPKKFHILFEWTINTAFNVEGYFKTLVLKTFFI